MQTLSQPIRPVDTGAFQKAINLLDYWKVLRRSIWTIAAVFTIVVGLVALWTYTQVPVYRAVATVEVRTDVRKILPGQDNAGLGATGFSWSAEERFYNTQIEILKSRDLADRVVRKLGLAADPLFKGNKSPAEILAAMVGAVPRTDTGIVEITISGTNPARIAEIANAVADEYIQRNIDRARKSMRDLIVDMTKQVEELSRSAQQAEEKKFETGEMANVYVPETQTDVLGKQLSQYMDSYTKTKIELGELQAVLKSVDAVTAAGGDLLTVKDIATQPAIVSLNNQRSDLERDIEGLRVKYLASHPDLRKKTTELDVVRARLTDEIARVVKGYRENMNVKSAQVAQLDSQIEATRAQLFEVGKRSTEFGIASRDAITKANIYVAIQTKLNETAVTSGLLSNNLNVLDYATVPARPIRPRKLLNLFLGVIAGLLGGIGTVFFIDHLNNTIKSIEDVEQGLALPVLAIIPRYRETTSSAVKEAFQTLKTNVLFSSDARKRNLVLMTSAGPREGKSSTVINLARTIASAGEKVVIVDCDLRRPTVHEQAEVERDHGLTNYLTAVPTADIGSYLKPTSTPNLSVLTCGPIPPNPPELFGGERFPEVLKELRKRFDWVLLDSPPVILLTDSVILASMADMVVFVVKHNESDREMIRRCLQSIRNVNPHVIGAVLNNVDIEKSYSKDYYYAGYYYYSGEGASKKKRGRTPEIAEGGAASS